MSHLLRSMRSLVISTLLGAAASCASNADLRRASGDGAQAPAEDAGARPTLDASSFLDGDLGADRDAYANEDAGPCFDAAPDANDSAAPDGAAAAGDAPRVLVFTRTLGYRHDSIAPAVAALRQLAQQRAWTLVASEDPAMFSDLVLADYDVAAFVHTTGDVLDELQQGALTRFIQRGKGWVGVHSASDTEYDWPWYGELVGAYFLAHPEIQAATLRVELGSHLATAHLADTWTRRDEWYGFRTNPRARVSVLMSLDETSYDAGSTAMGDHPIAWYHSYDGGRAFYTALGHTTESWSEPAFLAHVAGAIEWAAGYD